MATRTRSDVQKLTHDNYATAVGAVTKSLPSNTTSIFIENMDASISVLVSFDGGTLFKVVKAGSAISADVDNIQSYRIKSASGTPNVECLYGSEN